MYKKRSEISALFIKKYRGKNMKNIGSYVLQDQMEGDNSDEKK